MDRKPNFILKDDSGAALVVALLMIVILSLIGLASSSTSTFEIRLSGNKRGATDAFYSSDAGAQSVLADITNFNTTGWAAITNANFNTNTFLLPRQELKTEFISTMLITSAAPSFSLPPGINFTDAPQITRMLLDQTVPARGIGTSAIAFQYNYYIVDSVGKDQKEVSLAKSNCEIREKIVRLLPTE